MDNFDPKQAALAQMAQGVTQTPQVGNWAAQIPAGWMRDPDTGQLIDPQGNAHLEAHDPIQGSDWISNLMRRINSTLRAEPETKRLPQGVSGTASAQGVTSTPSEY